MPATSGPLPPEDFPQSLWQQHFLAENGITDDIDGSAFSITLPPSGDVAEIGSATIDSLAKVRGYPIKIAAGTTEPVTIPPSLSGGTTGRTDLVVAQCNIATFTTEPGPVRLVVIPGTEGSLTVPAYDPKMDLRLHAVRRRQGEALNQAIVTPLRSWTAAPIVVEDGAPLPTTAPLGTRARRGVQEFVRQMVGGVPTWVDLQANIGLWQDWSPVFNTSNVTLRSARFCRIGNNIDVAVRVLMKSMGSASDVFTCSVPVPGRTTAGWIDPLGTASGRRGGNTGAHVFTGIVVANGSGTLNTVTVVATDEQFGGQWRSSHSGGPYPISWTDNGGAEVGLRWSYEAAS